ncbi:SWI/SNF-related matrix-associated actin-dependent regulator of chromatin subfamily D member 1-like [Liolophura sinensis]|uniref:SWI/SNF-related matrix-associated actin-dependent regulator of chromatin subfamily D member 1-like n=1 Tax=Liolophura sinensis TaxID=3198878 RepID=UPI003157F4A8
MQQQQTRYASAPPMRTHYAQPGYPSPRPGYSGGPQQMGGPAGVMPPRMAMAPMQCHPYGGMPRPMPPGMPPHPGMQSPMDRKRSGDMRPPHHSQGMSKPKKKKKIADKILPQRVRDLVPESQAYMDLLAFERKLDSTIMRKRLDIQEALKRPQKQKRKLRIFISNTFYPARMDNEDGEETVASWELRVEGRLLEDPLVAKMNDNSKMKRKFSSFFKSLVIELDKDLYGPDNHLVEVRETRIRQNSLPVKKQRELLEDWETVLSYCPDLNQHTSMRMLSRRRQLSIVPWVKELLPFVESRVEGPDAKKTACYDIDVEVDDTLRQQMNSFLLSTQSQQEIATLDNKIHETVETINSLKTHRDFFLSFAKDPQEFINNWLLSQMRDLKTMTDVVGNPEEERRADYFHQPWCQEAVCRYFYGKIQQRRLEIEQALGIRNT